MTRILKTNVLTQVALLVALSLAAGAVANVARHQPLPWVEDWRAKKLSEFGTDGVVSQDEARQIFEAGVALFVDAREAEYFAEGHIPGAVNVPFSPVDPALDGMIAKLPRDRRLVVYCEGVHCPLAEELGEYLRDAGVLNFVIFPEGIEGWRAAGLAEEAGS